MKGIKWISLVLIVLLTVSMVAGCKSADPEEDAAALDSYVEDEAPAGAETNEEDDGGEKDETNDKTDEAQKEETKKPSASGNKTEENASDQKEETKDPAGTGDQDEEPEQPDDSNTTLDWEEPEDPYADIPISKTPAVTEDGVSYYKENQIKVVSYNILVNNSIEDHTIDDRAPRLLSVLDKYDPDIIGFQEYVPSWSWVLNFDLSEEYEYVNQWRSTSNQEGTPILWKKEKFELVDSGYFWLSETPNEESKGWSSTYYRICNWVQLKVRQTGAIFYFFNTHFDFTADSQVGSAELLIQKAKKFGSGASVIVTADFNMRWESDGYKKMSSYFTDVNLERDPSITYQGLKTTGGSLIDFCFVTESTVKPTKYKVMNEMFDGKFVSDHYGVYSEVIILQK